MIIHRSISLKKIWLWCLIIACGLMSAYLAFISLVSVWIGLGHMHQAGFWVPIIFGITLLMIVSYICFQASRYILNHIKEENPVNI